MKLALAIAALAVTHILASLPAGKPQEVTPVSEEATDAPASKDGSAMADAPGEVTATDGPLSQVTTSPGTGEPADEDEDEDEDEGDDLETGEDQVLIGQSNTIEEDERVKGDAVVVGGNLTVYGRVDGDAVCVGGKLTVGPKAVIDGDAVNVGGKADIDEGATIGGEKVNVGVAMGPFEHLRVLRDMHDAKHDGDSGFMKRLMSLVWEIAMFAFFMFVALLLTVFMPRQFVRIEEHLTGSFPRSALMGAAVMIIVPIVVLVLLVTIVGIPLIPLVIMAVSVAMLVGYVVFGRVLGRRLVGERHVMTQILVGLLLLGSAGMLGDALALPGGVMESVAHVFKFVGGVIFVGSSFAGLGAVLYSHWGKRTFEETRAMHQMNGHGHHFHHHHAPPPPADPTPPAP